MKIIKNSLMVFCAIALITIKNVNGQTFILWGAPTPTANLTSTDANDTICVGDPVAFNATIQSGCTYQFFVNGVSVQGPGSANTYVPSPPFGVGSQQVVLVVDNGSCSARDTINFATLAAPTATLVSNAPANTACAGTAVTFTATGGTNYNFRINGNSVQNGASNTYTTSSLTNGQQVDVIVTNAGGCSATSAPITMTILPKPTVASVTGNPTPVCVNQNGTVTLTGLSGTPPYSFEIYNNNAGVPGTLYYTVPGTIPGPNGTIQVPIPAVGFSTMHIRIRDGNGCWSW